MQSFFVLEYVFGIKKHGLHVMMNAYIAGQKFDSHVLPYNEHLALYPRISFSFDALRTTIV
jgi:hypothetical protein